MIDYEKHLNPAQWEAVRTTEGPILVIAGAGSGKTRTIVYRLAYLADKGVRPESILLLTFTRKASHEMLERAGLILGRGALTAAGGTFHSFSANMLRRHGRLCGYPDGFTILDRADSEDVIKKVKEAENLGNEDRTFPKKGTVVELISKARNKEKSIDETIRDDYFHLAAYAPDIRKIAEGYAAFKKEHGLMDYDDLLFGLEQILTANTDLRDFLRMRYPYLMVDEYQDTNLVQARIVKLLAGEAGNVMAVGDDAQSIYSFRGANIRNILDFPKIFPGTRLIRLEENYRSTQPILDLTNRILENAKERYEKKLFTRREAGPKPEIIRPVSDRSQAQIVGLKILELSKKFPLSAIAVLFRAGYQSYQLEIVLNKFGLKYRKYGGQKFSEAAHIKDVLSYLRLLVNAADFPAWQRALAHIKGIGTRTTTRIFEALMAGDSRYLESVAKKRPDFRRLLDFLDGMRQGEQRPAHVAAKVVEFYEPTLVEEFADDYPYRKQGLEQLVQIAAQYEEIGQFLAELSLESPEENGGLPDEDHVVLSTVHSAKGLEWTAVMIIDLVDDRFPSKYAQLTEEDLEEERRLLYVACTRAKEYLGLFAPESVYNRCKDISERVVDSMFLREIPAGLYDEMRENFSGGLSRINGPDRTPAQPLRQAVSAAAPRQAPVADGPDGPDGPDAVCGPEDIPVKPRALKGPVLPPEKLGFARHRIFGRGKLVAFLPPDKYKVNFPGYGLKVILAEYLTME